MKAPAALLVSATSLGAVGAFVAPAVPRHGAFAVARPVVSKAAVSGFQPALRPHRGVRMLVEPKGSDSFKAIEEEVEANPVRATAGKLSPGVAKAVLTGIVPAAALVGWAVVPGAAVVSGVGAAISATAGNVARKKVARARREAAPAAAARLLEEKGVGNTTAGELKTLLASYGLAERAIEGVLVQLYTKYLLAMCKGSAATTSEIKELSEMRETLGLDGVLLGEAHYAAAGPIYNQYVLMTPEKELQDEWSPNRRTLDKFLFLCDRMFEVCDTEEAYKYEMGRIGKIFELTFKDIKARCSAIAKPFYEKALESAATRLETVRPEALARARKTLGISDDEADILHRAALRSEVQNLARSGDPEGKKPLITDEGKGRLDKMGAVLGLDEEEATKEIESVVIPTYQDALSKALESILKDPSPRNVALLYGGLAVLQGELQLGPNTAGDVLVDMVRTRAQGLFTEARKFTRVKNKKEAVAKAAELVEFANSAISMVESVEGELRGVDPVDRVFNGPLVVGKTAKEGAELYKNFLTWLLGAEKLDEKQIKSQKTLARLMGVNAMDEVSAYREACGDRVGKRLEETVRAAVESGEFDEAKKASNEQLMEDLKVPREIYNERAKMLYQDSLEAWAGKGKIPTLEEKATLDNIRGFLGIAQEEVDELHAELCTPQYEQSVQESMGATGVIADDLKAALEQLRERLGLSKAAAQKAFYSAVFARMKPMLKQIFYEFERSVLSKEQMAAKHGKDAGSDIMGDGSGGEGSLGIESSGAVISDILNLIDFYEENDVLQKKTKKVVDPDTGETTEVEELVFPVTAEDITNEKVREQLYTNFVVNAFSVKDEDLKRYEGGQAKLAGILAIPPAKIKKVHRDIGSTVVGKFVNQQLNKATSLGPQDIAFLANIQAKLEMAPEDFNSLVNDAKIGYVKSRGELLFQRTEVTPEYSRKVRETAQNLGVDIVTQAQLGIGARKKMFVVEAADAIEGGVLDGDAGREFIEELQETLSMSDTVAQETLLSLLDNKAKQTLGDMMADAKGGNSERLAASTKKLLRYAGLADGLDVDFELDAETKEAIYNTFEASVAGEKDEEAMARDEKDLGYLRRALKFGQQAEKELSTV